VWITLGRIWNDTFVHAILGVSQVNVTIDLPNIVVLNEYEYYSRIKKLKN
jgi:hypothetical protein